MLRSWKLGSAFGIGIFVHWSFSLLLLSVVFFSWKDGLDAVAFSVLLVLAMFGCVVLHELGHALAGRDFGIQTRDITLYAIGGVARMERMSEVPWEEFCIAVAGPAINVIIVLLLCIGFIATGIIDLDGTLPDILQLIGSGDMEAAQAQFALPVLVLIALLPINLALVIFNMIPAFPMDGGRVLRAALARFMGHRAATETAATLGMFIAVAMVLSSFKVITLPLLGSGNPFLALVGLFVFFVGRQELYAVRYRDAQRRAAGWSGPRPVPAPFIRPSAVAPEPHFSGFTWDRRHRVWIEWRDGRLLQACWVPSE